MKQLLIIDNEETILFALKRYFAKLRWRVDAASELEEAEALVAHTRYDLVIADLRTPGLDGPRLLTALSERFGETLPPVVFLTSHTFDPHYGGFLADLRAPVLVKPLKPGRVLELVGRVLQP